MNLTVTVRGTDALTLRTKRLIAAAQTGLKFGVSEAAFLFETEAKKNSPVATGANRDSIRTDVVTDEPAKQVLSVAPHMPYSARLEFGFIGADSRGRVYHQAPRPYMRPAYEAKKEEARAAIKDGVIEELKAA